MLGIDGNRPPSEVSVDADDDWVIVKKQRITILIPPPSPAAASCQDNTQQKSSGLTCLAKKSRGDCAARKKHPNQMLSKKAQGIKVSANIKEAQESASENKNHKDISAIRGDISSRSPVASVVKADQTVPVDHAAIEGQVDEDIVKTGNSFGNIYKPELPVISSQVTNKIIRARLLDRRVAAFGGLRNWLFTCGLGWFVDILDNEKLGMYQIVSLTMNQLKDMGLDAVGPRRKLIHAIESVSQPNQFEIFS
uniref:SAM domain-containing protein n=1 Tax=Leersia perrieri TaxID=77586 RepID=A0A0D9X7D8_9ORYZ